MDNIIHKQQRSQYLIITASARINDTNIRTTYSRSCW